MLCTFWRINKFSWQIIMGHYYAICRQVCVNFRTFNDRSGRNNSIFNAFEIYNPLLVGMLVHIYIVYKKHLDVCAVVNTNFSSAKTYHVVSQRKKILAKKWLQPLNLVSHSSMTNFAWRNIELNLYTPNMEWRLWRELETCKIVECWKVFRTKTANKKKMAKRLGRIGEKKEEFNSRRERTGLHITCNKINRKTH